MKVVKRSIAILLGISLILSVMGIALAVQSNPTSATYNFEDENNTGILGNWAGQGSFNIGSAGDNNKALVFTATTNSYTVGGFKTDFCLESNKKYTLSFRYKNNGATFVQTAFTASSANAGNYTFFRVNGNDPSNNKITTEDVVLNANTWTKVSYIIDTTETGDGKYVNDTNKYLSFAYKTWANKDYELYIDDIKIEPYSGEAETIVGKVYDFNDPEDSGLSVKNGFNYVTDESGNGYYEGNAGSYGLLSILTDYKLVKDQKYKVTFKYWVNKTDAVAHGLFPTTGKKGDTAYNFFNKHEGNDQWKDGNLLGKGTANRIDFTVANSWAVASFEIDPAKSNEVITDELNCLGFVLQNWGADIKLAIDDLTIKPVSADGTIVTNGDFEGTLSAADWMDTDKIASLSTTEKHTGDASLKLSGGNYSGVIQSISVEKNTNYELSFWYKGKFGYIPNWGVTFASTAINDAYALGLGMLEDTNEWTEKKFVFSSGEHDTLNLIFQSGYGCEFYIDDVSVTETEATPGSSENAEAPLLIAQLPHKNNQIRYLAKDGKNLITNSDFEAAEAGNWASLTTDGIMKVVEDNTVLSVMGGNKVLKYENTSGQTKWNYLYINVEPNTEYYFSMWVKGEYYNKATNRNDLTFGIANANTGKFIVPSSVSKTYTEDSQFRIPTYDEEWHLVTKNFNSKSATTIAFAFRSSSAIAYIDNLQIYKAIDAVRYESLSQRLDYSKVIENNPILSSCDDDKNLFTNGDCSAATDTFWSSGVNFGISDEKSIYGNFLEIKDTGSLKGKALHYIPNDKITGYPLGTLYYKTVTLKPNTEYTFSIDYCIIKDADRAYVALLDDNKYYPTKVATVELNDLYFDPDYKWQTYSCTFKTPDRENEISFVIPDVGGEFYFDNVKLFETQYAKAATVDSLPTKLITDDYTVSDGYITNIPEGTTVKTVINNLGYKNYVKVYKDGKEITDKNALVSTGMEFRYMDGFSVYASSTVVIAGEANGDGKTDRADVQFILKHLTGKAKLSELQILALDVDKNGVVDVNDCALISKHVTGISKLKNLIIK